MIIEMSDDTDRQRLEQDEREQWESLTPNQQFEIMLKDPKFKREYEAEMDKLAERNQT